MKHWTKPIEKRLAPLIEKYGEGSDELWEEKLKIEAECGAMLFKRLICICPEHECFGSKLKDGG